MSWHEFLNHLVALLVISNPLSALPAILRFSRNLSDAEKRNLALTTTLAVGAIFFTTIWIGKVLLQVLGIQLAAFQAVGGIILLLLAFSMLSAEDSPIKQGPDDKAKTGDSPAFVPLAMPIIAGPGAISALIVSVSQFSGLKNQILISLSALIVTLAMGCILYFACALEKGLGNNKIKVINRIGGLILASIGLQTLATGLLTLFPGLQGAY